MSGHIKGYVNGVIDGEFTGVIDGEMGAVVRAKDSVERLREYEVDAGEAQPRLTVEEEEAAARDLADDAAEGRLQESEAAGADCRKPDGERERKKRGAKRRKKGAQEAANHEA